MSDYRDEYKNSYALVIGIDTYTDPRFAPLGNAEEDAAAFAELIKRPPFNFDVSTLFGKDATRDGIETALFQLRATGPDDRVLVYFAGHGYTLVDEFKQESGYLAAADTVPEKDYTALDLESVTDLTRRAKAKHIAFLFDACYSGQALGLARSSAGVTSDKFLTRRAFQVISAGAGDQTVSDVYSMTGVLLEGLKAGIADEDGLVTLSEIGLYLQKTIAADSGRTQIPQFGHLRGSQGGEFVFYQDTSVRLPNDLQSALASAREGIRVSGVEELGQICLGTDAELAKVARARLERILTEDASTKVKTAARRALFPGSEDEETVHSAPRPIATGVESPAPRPPATRQRKSSGKKQAISTPMLIGGIAAAAVLGLGVIVCLLAVLAPPPRETQVPEITDEMTVDITDEPTAPPRDQAQIKEEVLVVLDKAYSLKQSTLHDLTKDGLDGVYTDKALEDRIYAVDQAIANNCYWNVNLVQPDENEFVYVGTEAVLVRAKRVEFREYICNGVINEDHSFQADRFYIRFLLVLKNDAWYVSDYDSSDLPDN